MPNVSLEACLRQVGKGWAPLIKRIYRALPEGAYITQVKEKWGGLRFYVDGVTDEIYNLVEAAEEESYTICEECGEPGRPREGGWVLTLCDKCAKERGYG